MFCKSRTNIYILNHLVPITRNGKREDVYWTYSFGPIDDDTSPGGIGGIRSRQAVSAVTDAANPSAPSMKR